MASPASQQVSNSTNPARMAQVNAAIASQQELVEWATSIRKAPHEAFTVKLLCCKPTTAKRGAGKQRCSSKQQLTAVQPPAYTSDQHRTVLAEASAKLSSDKLRHLVQDALSRVVSVSALRHLELCVKLSNKLYEELSTALTANSSLEVLSLAGSCCGDGALAVMLPALTNHPKLQVLELPGCCLTDTSACRLAALLKAQAAAAAQQAWVAGLRGAGAQGSCRHSAAAAAAGSVPNDSWHGLRVLDISQNQVSAAVVPALAAALADEHSSVMHLSLASNQLPAAETTAGAILQVILQDPPNRSFTVDIRGNAGSAVGVGGLAGADGNATLPHLGVWAGMFSWDASKLAAVASSRGAAAVRGEQQKPRCSHRPSSSKRQPQHVGHSGDQGHMAAAQVVAQDQRVYAGTAAVLGPEQSTQQSSDTSVQQPGTYMPSGACEADNTEGQQQQQLQESQQTQQQTALPACSQTFALDAQHVAAAPNVSIDTHGDVIDLQQANVQPEQAVNGHHSLQDMYGVQHTGGSTPAGSSTGALSSVMHLGHQGHLRHLPAAAADTPAASRHQCQQHKTTSECCAEFAAGAEAAAGYQQAPEVNFNSDSSRQEGAELSGDQALLQVLAQQQQMLEMLIQRQEATQQQQQQLPEASDGCDEHLLEHLAEILSGLSEQVDALEQMYDASQSQAQQEEEATSLFSGQGDLQRQSDLDPNEQQKQQQQCRFLAKAAAMPPADASAIVSRAFDGHAERSPTKCSPECKASHQQQREQPSPLRSHCICSSINASWGSAGRRKHLLVMAASENGLNSDGTMIEDISQQLHGLHGLS